MKNIHQNLDSSSFAKPNNILEVEVCTSSNTPATLECEDTYLEYFLEGTIPDFCTKHTGDSKKIVKINNSTKSNISEFIEKKIDEIITKKL